MLRYKSVCHTDADYVMQKIRLPGDVLSLWSSIESYTFQCLYNTCTTNKKIIF